MLDRFCPFERSVAARDRTHSRVRQEGSGTFCEFLHPLPELSISGGRRSDELTFPVRSRAGPKRRLSDANGYMGLAHTRWQCQGGFTVGECLWEISGMRI